MGVAGGGLHAAIMQAKAAVMVSLVLKTCNHGIEFAAASELGGRLGQEHEVVAAKLRQLLYSLCVLLQMVFPTAAGMRCALRGCMWQL